MKSSLPSPDPLALPDGLTLCDDGLVRPTWASHDALLRSYYDTEWGMPVHDEAGVYERLALEGFQAGLSWRTVLAKRDSFREAFAGFSPDAVAAFTDADVERLASNPSIIRNRRKIEAAIANARATIELRVAQSACPSSAGPSHLGELVWSYRGGPDPRPTCASDVPSQTPRVHRPGRGPESAGLPFRRPHHDACPHGGHWNRQHRHRGNAPTARARRPSVMVLTLVDSCYLA